MKLYAVKPEWLYGDDKDAKREVQLEILKRLGIQESEAMGMAICNAEQAIELFEAGYCGSYASPKEHIKLLYDVKSEVDIASLSSHWLWRWRRWLASSSFTRWPGTSARGWGGCHDE